MLEVSPKLNKAAKANRVFRDFEYSEQASAMPNLTKLVRLQQMSVLGIRTSANEEDR